MDLRKLDGGFLSIRAMTRALVLASVVCLPVAARAESSLWLVRPLYPGQEALVARTEAALDKLMPGDARLEAVIGTKELSTAMKGHRIEEVPCFSPETRCADPIDPFFTALGYERIVLIYGGQDELGFKFRVSAYEPRTGRVTPASATNANLERALLGAIAKVVPAASTLEVKSNPAGATVFVDDVKVGTTPLSTQVLPGERVVRLDLKLHQPIEETLIIPIRGSASLDKTLEKVAARIVITASPVGTDVFVDGQLLGKDKVDRGILPGTHTIRLVADKHKAFEQQISVRADEQFVLDKSLEPIAGPDKANGRDVKDTPATVKIVTPPPAQPAPASESDLIYDRRSWAFGSFEFAQLNGNSLVARRWGNAGTGRTETLTTPARTLMGGSIEYGTGGKYVGVTVFGLSFLTNTDAWGMNIGFTKGGAPEVDQGVIGPRLQDRVSVKLVSIRALQPQVRLVAWKFLFSLQAGLEFRTGQISGMDVAGSLSYDDMTIFDGSKTFYKDGFMPLDLMVAGRVNVRFYAYDGLFILAQANYTQYIIGESTNTDAKSSSTWGFNVGVGYGF